MKQPKGEIMRDKLYRSRRQRIIAGVAGGLAQYFNIDPIIVRVLFVVITLLHGMGIILYIILWIVVPEEPFEIAYGIKPEEPNAATTDNPQTGSSNIFNNVPEMQKKNSGRFVAGTILIVIGALFLMVRFIPSFDLGDVFPFLLVIIGALLILNSVKK
jgi:phage shock protein C